MKTFLILAAALTLLAGCDSGTAGTTSTSNPSAAIRPAREGEIESFALAQALDVKAEDAAKVRAGYAGKTIRVRNLLVFMSQGDPFNQVTAMAFDPVTKTVTDTGLNVLLKGQPINLSAGSLWLTVKAVVADPKALTGLPDAVHSDGKAGERDSRDFQALVDIEGKVSEFKGTILSLKDAKIIRQ